MTLATGLVALHSATTDPNIITVIDSLFQLCIGSTVIYCTFAQQLFQLDGELFDIPTIEEEESHQFRESNHLCLDHRLDDVFAKKLTNFPYMQLRRMYNCFGLRDVARQSRDGEHIYVHTGHFHKGTPCCYKYHPEEMFLYVFTKMATGMSAQKIVDAWFGGDYTRWVFGYRWCIWYLDERYKNIIGHQSLLRYLDDFPRFHRCIEAYCQRDRVYTDKQTHVREVVPGIPELPQHFSIFGFIDDSHEHVCTPFAGPDGDFQGAPRRREYDLAQQAIYSGYTKLHGIKTENVLLPNGISTCYGPVSSRRNDRGVLNSSGINGFLESIQMNSPVVYKLLGDGIFGLGLRCIVSYYRAAVGRPLTQDEKDVNSALKAARITVEKHFSQQNVVFRICNYRYGFKLAQKHGYAVEQLRVCYLLVNCYNCMNGDQAGSTNTFGCSPPKLEEYLAL